MRCLSAELIRQAVTGQAPLARRRKRTPAPAQAPPPTPKPEPEPDSSPTEALRDIIDAARAAGVVRSDQTPEYAIEDVAEHFRELEEQLNDLARAANLDTASKPPAHAHSTWCDLSFGARLEKLTERVQDLADFRQRAVDMTKLKDSDREDDETVLAALDQSVDLESAETTSEFYEEVMRELGIDEIDLALCTSHADGARLLTIKIGERIIAALGR